MKQLLILAVLMVGKLAAGAEPRPNFVFIISDDQRWDAIGAAGNPHVITPNLDRLARDGTYFRQATISTPQCSPARASLLTGVYTHSHGKYSNQHWRPDARTAEGSRQPMLPAVLRGAGYHTVLVGKWHLFNEPWNCGFSDVRLWMPEGSGPKKDPQLARGNSRQTEAVPGFTTEIFADSTIQFLQGESAKQKPFFIWHADTHPHLPLEPVPQRISKLYDGKQTPDLLPPGFPGNIPTHNFRAYYECCTHLDEQVGRIIRTLEDRGLADNTVIVYLGDNGFMMGSRRVGAKGAAGKVIPYDESIRVPMIVKLPAGGSKGISDAPVSSIDLPVMFLQLAGVDVPSEWHGRDLSKLLKHSRDDAIDAAFVEFADNRSKQWGDLAYRLVRTRSHKLITWGDPGKNPELYDLLKDPREQNNLYGVEAAKPVREQLQRRLGDWLKKTGDEMFTPPG